MYEKGYFSDSDRPAHKFWFLSHDASSEGLDKPAHLHNPMA